MLAVHNDLPVSSELDIAMANSCDIKLRLSAQRALLGAISPSVRLVKVIDDGREIVFSVIAAETLDSDATDALTAAAAEIVADYSNRTISERFSVFTGPLPREDIFEYGWVYLRAE